MGRDISIVSFDNDELASYLRPGLTTIGLPHVEMGREAVRLLLSAAAPGERLIPMPIVERHSIELRDATSDRARRARERLPAR